MILHKNKVFQILFLELVEVNQAKILKFKNVLFKQEDNSTPVC